jgi:hypothetical protein
MFARHDISCPYKGKVLGEEKKKSRRDAGATRGRRPFRVDATSTPGRAAALDRRRPFERSGWRTGSQVRLPGTIYRAPTKAKSWAKRRKRAGETPALQEDDARSRVDARSRPGQARGMTILVGSSEDFDGQAAGLGAGGD